MIDKDIIKKKMKQVDKLFEAKLDVDDENLFEQITCGDNWDDPNVLGKALNEQPSYYARWAYFLKQLKMERAKLDSVFKTWIAAKKEEIREQIYDENIKKDMTPNNAAPTGNTIDDRFRTVYQETNVDGEYVDGEYRHYDKISNEIESEVIKVDIVVKAFEQRHSMLISMSNLLRSMMDNQLIVKKMKAFDED